VEAAVAFNPGIVKVFNGGKFFHFLTEQRLIEAMDGDVIAVIGSDTWRRGRCIGELLPKGLKVQIERIHERGILSLETHPGED
jgi:hypothetical protein